MVIPTNDNEGPTTSFTFDEFKEATFSMQTDKCLRPDGFNLYFYQIRSKRRSATLNEGPLLEIFVFLRNYLRIRRQFPHETGFLRILLSNTFVGNCFLRIFEAAGNLLTKIS